MGSKTEENEAGKGYGVGGKLAREKERVGQQERRKKMK